tara:strand:- start:1819 stop:3567 length:1749 start_codon:yes stop_codon:yes gene_type:complete
MEYKSNILENLRPDYIQLGTALYLDKVTNNVSIGEIQGLTFTSRFMVKSTDSTANQIVLQHSGNGVAIVGIGQESSHGSLQLRLNSGATQVRLSATNNNYIIPSLGVGGVTSPNAKLHIAGGSSGMFLSNLGDNSAYDSIKMSYTGYNSGTPEFIFTQTSTPGSGLANTWYRFKNTNGVYGTNPNNVANVTIGGLLGIGEDNPGAKLDIVGEKGGVSVRVKGSMSTIGSYYYGYMYDGSDVQGTTQSNIFYAGGAVKANTTIADWASFRIDAPIVSASGAVITNNYGIYQASTVQKNFFAGNVNIGAIGTGKLNVAGTVIVGNSGTSRFTDTSAFPLQLNRGLDVDVFGANGCLLGLGSLKGSTYIDGARVSGGLAVNGTDGFFSIQTLGSSAYSTSISVNSVQAVKFDAYDGANKTGTPTYLLGTDASGNVVKTNSTPAPITSQADSLYDLIPNGAFTTTYAFTSTAGTYAEVMKGDDVITDTGTYSVQMLVNDFAVGGTQYDVKYSGVMSWHAGSTNDTGQGTESEIVLHRNGHASNVGITYLRTRETALAESNELRLEIMCNRTYSAASNVVFKFVRLI